MLLFRQHHQSSLSNRLWTVFSWSMSGSVNYIYGAKNGWDISAGHGKKEGHDH